MSLKPICVRCQRFYRPRKNGFYFVEAMPIVSDANPGRTQAHLWKPYKLWRGDLWKCEGCDHLLVAGVAQHPIDEHYRESFIKNVEAVEKTTGVPVLQVNDC